MSRVKINPERVQVLGKRGLLTLAVVFCRFDAVALLKDGLSHAVSFIAKHGSTLFSCCP